MLQVGDAVRMRPGSDVEPLLGALSDLTGTVVAVFDDMDPVRLNVLYGAGGPLVSTVPAAEFVRDSPLDAAPF